MPTVTVEVEKLFELIGKNLSDSEFEDLCFDFGIELEDVMMLSELQGNSNSNQLIEKDEKIFRIDIPANRYDMLCVEGIARAIKTYLGLNGTNGPVAYALAPTPSSGFVEIHVRKETKQVRPFVVGAVLRDFTFDKKRYDGFIELQDKLHNNICRKRTLVAIGTHDLDTVQGPFRYEAREPQNINFIPLNQQKSMNANELMEFYQSDRKLSKFLHIIKDKPRYPVIYDSKDRVLSLPPIINGDHSKIKFSTRNIFIECTATDLTKANVVLNTIVTMYSAYCKTPFVVEPVKVVYEEDGASHIYPQFEPRTMEAKVDYINTCVGINESAQSLASLLTKMSLSSTVSEDESTLKVVIPPTRSDILHPCDIMEDAAIAFNYNKIKETMPKSSTIAVPLPINKLTDMLRKELAFSGYTECLAFTLCSHDENFAFLRKKDRDEAVVLANPKTQEYQVVRTSLLPGLFKTLASNKHVPLPLKLFEVSDVVLRDESVDRRARNERRLSCVYANTRSGIEEIRGMVDRLSCILSVEFKVRDTSENPTFFPGRGADVLFGDVVVGGFGIVHPEVIEAFEVGFPCSALEINIEPFL